MAELGRFQKLAAKMQRHARIASAAVPESVVIRELAPIRHLVGSRLLAEMGEALKSNCRLIDFAFRYGGDEFVILLPQTSKENAINVARRLHRLIRETVWLQKEALNIKVTPSVGLAAYPVDSRTKEGLLHLADEAMYLVKNTDRDNVAAANMGILPVASSEAAG